MYYAITVHGIFQKYEKGAVTQWVRHCLLTVESCTRVPVCVSAALLPIQLPDKALRKQQRLAQMLESLPSTWETQMELSSAAVF